MKKQTIWILTILMGITLLGLLGIQVVYMANMYSMLNDQFEQAAKMAVRLTIDRINHDITESFADEVRNVQTQSSQANWKGEATIVSDARTTTGITTEVTIKGDPKTIAKLETVNPKNENDSLSKTDQLVLDKSYTDSVMSEYRQNLIREMMIDLVRRSDTQDITSRINTDSITSYLKKELQRQDLDVEFDYMIYPKGATETKFGYKTAGYPFDIQNDLPKKDFVEMPMFRKNISKDSYRLKVYFPKRNKYIYTSVPIMAVSLVFTIVIIIVFVFTIITAFRQKKLTEMKNDFINNMTHEFKTPISSISLAAQMLNDQSVRKSPVMLNQISNVINDETKRMRFLVEKVLQMSMFEGKKAVLKLEDADANLIIYNITNTFKLKVEKYGGKITTRLDAMNGIVEVDEMHFTNVIFNLLDNAVKYRREDEPLNLQVSTDDLPGERLQIVIQDNGIGISKEDQKRIFEKFYRVSTGNRHDVKGFGLGLAYVHKMITELGGTITVDSHVGKGTKFIIILPLSKS